MIIHAEVYPTPDSPTVRFREPKNKVDLPVELPKILKAQGWGAGTYFNIQFISHDRTELYSSASFVVTSEKEATITSNPESRSPNTKTVHIHQVSQMSEWTFFGEAATDTPVLKWNPGKKQHEVLQSGNVIFSSKDKDEAEAALDKAA